MAVYLAMRIEAEKLDYVKIFSKSAYQQFKTEVDEILTLNGREDLIKSIE